MPFQRIQLSFTFYPKIQDVRFLPLILYNSRVNRTYESVNISNSYKEYYYIWMQATICTCARRGRNSGTRPARDHRQLSCGTSPIAPECLQFSLSLKCFIGVICTILRQVKIKCPYGEFILETKLNNLLLLKFYIVI